VVWPIWDTHSMSILVVECLLIENHMDRGGVELA
jgi:hypothetical protein